MERPKLACCNFIPDPGQLRNFALSHGFDGVEWSLTPQNLPQSFSQTRELAQTVSDLQPLEIRFHAALPQTDLGHARIELADEAFDLFRNILLLISELNGRYLTFHVGLGHDSTLPLSWDRTLSRLTELQELAQSLGITLCLENLAWGWTSNPHLFERLLRKTGLAATLDLGHALVSPEVQNLHFEVKDFVRPNPEKFLGAHVYHREIGDRHHPPDRLEDLSDRLHLLMRLPECNWWVLELREEAPLLQTLDTIEEFFLHKFIRFSETNQVPAWRE